MPDIRRNMVVSISNRRRFLWFVNPKVASRAIVEFVREHGECSVVECYKAEIDLDQFRDYWKFGFVRNPYDRLVSCWKNRVVAANHLRMPRGLYLVCRSSFNQFIRMYVDGKDLDRIDVHLKLQSSLLPVPDLDFVGRFENFEQDFRTVSLRILGRELIPTVRNASPDRRAFREYYSERLRRVVRKLYESDFRVFGYDD